MSEMKLFLLSICFVMCCGTHIVIDDIHRGVLTLITKRRIVQLKGKDAISFGSFSAIRSLHESRLKSFSIFNCTLLFESASDSGKEHPRVIRQLSNRFDYKEFESRWSTLSRETQLGLCYSLSNTIREERQAIMQMNESFKHSNLVLKTYEGILTRLEAPGDRAEILKFHFDLLHAAEEFDRFSCMCDSIRLVLYRYKNKPRPFIRDQDVVPLWPPSDSTYHFRRLVADVIAERSDVEKILLFLNKLTPILKKQVICNMAYSVLDEFDRERDEKELALDRMEKKIFDHHTIW